MFEDRVISLEEKISVVNTKITTLGYFMIEKLLVIKTVAKEKSTNSSVYDPYKFRDEIKYQWEENNTKNCYPNVTWKPKKYSKHAWFKNTRY